MQTTEINFSPLLKTGTLMGFSMGGILDGILPHALPFRWQEMWPLCSWLLMIVSLVMLWHTLTNPFTPASGKSFFGSLTVGWGLYLLAVNSLLSFLSRTVSAEEIVLLSLGMMMMIAGRVTVTRAKRRFYSQMLSGLKQLDVLGRFSK